MLESYFNLQFTLITYFICPQLFISFKVNCKFKVRKLVKAINISLSLNYHDNNGHPISKSNIKFCLKLFQLANTLSFSNFICPQLFIIFIVQTSNSKLQSWWKLLMEVYQWINMIISVIQFPNVNLCFAWSYFNLPFTLIFKFHMSSTFHLIYCTNCKFKVRKLVKAINGSVSMD